MRSVSGPALGLALLAASIVPGGAAGAPADARPAPKAVEVLDVARVWAGHPVGFALLTAGGRQFAAYYDAERNLTVAARAVGDKAWQVRVLPSRVGWDSHNYVTMAADADGHLHLSGNMHCNPLVYFRTARPGDVDSFERVGRMTGENEASCTYPRFMTGPAGELIFHYRDGRSGQGNEIYNVYDAKTKAWRRLLDRPLTDGRGKMNAYAHGPVKGPDGLFHLCWMWRNSPDCSTNHDLSYARSRDLVTWETAGGQPIALPIMVETPGVIVDPSPPKGGLINMGFGLGFDADRRPVITYHRYDDAGKSQVFNARWEEGRWRVVQASDWSYRWEFGGGGSIASEVSAGSVRVLPDGALVQSYSHAKLGSGTWKLDARTLKPAGTIKPAPTLPPGLGKLESSFPGMQVRWAHDLGESGEPGVRYVLRWETLGPNRDRPREGDLPEAGMMRVYKIED
jgi:hypothetical protein